MLRKEHVWDRNSIDRKEQWCGLFCVVKISEYNAWDHVTGPFSIRFIFDRFLSVCVFCARTSQIFIRFLCLVVALLINMRLIQLRSSIWMLSRPVDRPSKWSICYPHTLVSSRVCVCVCDVYSNMHVPSSKRCEKIGKYQILTLNFWPMFMHLKYK